LAPVTAPFLSFDDVTAPFAMLVDLTLFLPNVTAAYDVPPSAIISAHVAITFE
jgi:hypothetical protein